MYMPLTHLLTYKYIITQPIPPFKVQIGAEIISIADILTFLLYLSFNSDGMWYNFRSLLRLWYEKGDIKHE